MGNMAISFIISFVVAYIIGKPIIRKLQQMKFGQKILEDGPTWHMSKQYTPTMGGWIFIISIFVAIAAAMVIAGDVSLYSVDFIVAALALVFGIIGSVDDMTKIKKKQNAGLTP
ncbi:MAG: phospho-N-acetylmuramoyl-pentapeptide-transferase, partial [Clostridia bacterium]|nr:phospho-N-acetylmuramoyl-pentapeptide-transferase [Clostridia bacterium]